MFPQRSDSGERNRRSILRKESSSSSLVAGGRGGESHPLTDGQHDKNQQQQHNSQHNSQQHSSSHNKIVRSSIISAMTTSTVHIVPREIEFPPSHDAQNVRIYNDTETKIFYSFCSTRPSAFKLSDPEGQIQPKHYRDITISIVDKTVVEDTFRIRLHNSSPRGQRVGERILPVIIAQSSTSVTDDELRLRQSASTSSDLHSDGERLVGKGTTGSAYDNFPNEYLIYFGLMLCIFLLYLPNVHERDSNWPEICHVTVSVKIAAAYILGIITVMILRK